MAWIRPEDKMPPSGLEVLVEVSGYYCGGVVADHSFCIAAWLGNPDGGREPFWVIHGAYKDCVGNYYELSDPEIHAWMPLPKHFQKSKHFGLSREADMMEHAMFEDDPDWLYKGKAVYEQRTIEDVLADMERGQQ
jgi:hypothetical protein